MGIESLTNIGSKISEKISEFQDKLAEKQVHDYNNTSNETEGICIDPNDESTCQCVEEGSATKNVDLGFSETEPLSIENLIEKGKSDPDWEVFRPTGEDNGKVVYFTSAFPDKNEQGMVSRAKYFQRDDVKDLQAKGYTVALVNNTTWNEFQDIAYDPKTAGLIHFAHGSEGNTSVLNNDGKTGGMINPNLLNSDNVSENLEFVMMYSCTAGKKEEEWEKAFGGADVIGWNRVMKEQEVYLNSSAINPSSTSLANIIDKYL